MEAKNNISLIILISIILFSIKWVFSFVAFPEEEIILRVISVSISDSYFHYVKVLSELNLNNDYLENKNGFFLPIPIGSIIFHSILYKIVGIFSFIILELLFIFLFLFLFSSIFLKFNFKNNFSIFLAISLYSLPILINIINLNINELNTLGSTFYNLKFPRPLVTNIFLFYFLYFIVMNYNKELFTSNNIYIIGLFFALTFSSSFFIFLPLSIFLLIIIIKKYKKDDFVKKIKKFKKELLFSLSIFAVFISIFLYLIINSNPDYSSRMGIINLNIEDKYFLINYYFEKFFKTKNIFFIISSILSYYLIKKYLKNKYFYIIEIFFLNYICALINPFIFILISNKVAFLYHFNNLILINFFLYHFIILIFFYRIISDKFIFIKIKKVLSNSLIIVFLLINILNSYYFVKDTDANYRTDKNEIVHILKYKINRNCSVLTFDNSLMTYLILEEFKYIPYLNGTFSKRDDKILENNLINSLKLLNFTDKKFKEYMKSKYDGWRLKNANMQQLFWQKYQANSFYTYNNSKDFEKDEIKIIKNSSPFYAHQFVIPIYEKERLLKKFLKHEIKDIPDYIIIDKRHNFWPNGNISSDLFTVLLENKNFKIYFSNLPSIKCT